MKAKYIKIFTSIIAINASQALATPVVNPLAGTSFTQETEAISESKEKSKEKEVKALDTEAFILDETLWSTSLDDFMKKNSGYGLKWTSKAKTGIRSEGVSIVGEERKTIKGKEYITKRGKSIPYTTFGIKSGELLIKKSTKGRNVGGITVFFYNQGDNGQMSSVNFKSLAEKVKQAITEKTGKAPRDISKKGVVNSKKLMWKNKTTAYLLEQSPGAFIRLRVASLRSARGGESTANRSSLKSNVTYDRNNGDLYIENIPMVDQGKKGYCACASAARIYQYYGRSVDQHEIAQIAGSTAEGGTSPAKMIEAIKKVTKHLNTKTLVLYEYPKGISSKLEGNRGYKKYMSGIKELMKDVNAYQKLAKKKGVKGMKINGEEYKRVPRGYSIDSQAIYKDADPETFREVMIKKSSYRRFKSNIEKYIKQGIPVAWGLQLGVFKEQGLPQSSGGHMRLIIGLNKKTNELIYSDSWGEGHGIKKMDMGNAFTMTSMILVLPPNK